MGVLKKWFLLELTVIGFCLLSNQKCDAHILVYRRLTNQLIEEYNDLPAQFGPKIPPNAIKVFAVPADYGCETVKKPPRSDYPSTAKFVAIIERGGNCTFERKVRNAQNATYFAVIVYNNEGDDLEQMSAENNTGIHIPSVFVGHTTGINLLSFFTPEVVLVINDELPFNINTQLILPFSILIGLCFLIMVFYMIYKCIREQRRLRRYRLPKSMLKKIPILRYTKNNTDLFYETCVICLEDFVEDDKVRVLPCRHPYHSHCIDPWLTQNRRVCPICKRKVFTKGETRSSRNRQPSLDSVTDTDDDTTPLLREQPSGAAAAALEAAATTTANSANTTRHGTFRREGGGGNSSTAAADNNTSDDENILLAHQSPTHGARRINPFDRAPNLPPYVADMLNENQRPFWSRINFSFLFRRPTSNISTAAATSYLESGTETASLPTNAVISTATPAIGVAAPTSNNILNPNLSGSFKDDDDDLPPHRSIYEPITTPGTTHSQSPGATDTAAVADAAAVVAAADSVFLQTPPRGSIGVVALPNTSNNSLDIDVVVNAGNNANRRHFLI